MTGKDLKRWRKKNKYSQAALAGELGVGVMCISRWETKARRTSPLLPLALEGLEARNRTRRKRQSRAAGNAA